MIGKPGKRRPGIRRLSVKLTLIYALVFVTAIAIIDIMLVFSYSNNRFLRTEATYGEVAGVLNSMIARNIKIANIVGGGSAAAGAGAGMDTGTGEGASVLNARILYLDSEGAVLADSLGEYEGESIDNSEIRQVLAGDASASGYYKMDGRNMAMYAYRVSGESEPGSIEPGSIKPDGANLVGIILISAYMDEVYEDITGYTRQVILISACVLAIVLVVSFLLGEYITRPVKMLTDASRRMLAGDFSASVDINRNDEIGILSGTFNTMGKELDRIDKGRRRFMGDVSHELKSPLASIKALVGSLLGTGPHSRSEYREYLSDVDSEIDRMSALVNSLTTVARLEEIQPKPVSVDICAEVVNMLRIFQPLAQQKGIEMQNLCKHGLTVTADREMLREVLVNLVDNAIKYGKAGGSGYVRISASRDRNIGEAAQTAETVETKEATETAQAADTSEAAKIGTSKESGNGDIGSMVLSIMDNGQGIGDKDLLRIFESFYRADEARSRARDSGGSGMGLYIVKRICDINKWEIRAESEIGKGSVFNLRI